MLFNKRRQSRDSVLIEDMKSHIEGERLLISPFSEKLLAASGIKLKVRDKHLSSAGKNDFCFVEDSPLLPYVDDIDELIIYKWNREYPSDIKLDIAPDKYGFTLKAVGEFAGSSHDKITKEVYVK